MVYTLHKFSRDAFRGFVSFCVFVFLILSTTLANDSSSRFELKGSFRVGSKVKVSILDKQTQTSRWLEVNRPSGDFELLEFDTQSNKAVLLYQGQTVTLHMASASDEPIAIAVPVAPLKSVDTGSTSTPSPVGVSSKQSKSFARKHFSEQQLAQLNGEALLNLQKHGSPTTRLLPSGKRISVLDVDSNVALDTEQVKTSSEQAVAASNEVSPQTEQAQSSPKKRKLKGRIPRVQASDPVDVNTFFTNLNKDGD